MHTNKYVRVCIFTANFLHNFLFFYLSQHYHLQDLLQSYAVRLHMLRNESKRDPELLEFLINRQNTFHQNLSWSHFIRRPEHDLNQTLAVLKSFCVWFRSEFPYYYDACLSPDCLNRENNTFVGYVCPSITEREDGKAGTTA